MTETAGILPKKFAKRPKPISRTQAIKLIKFAQEHNFVINPAGYAYYAQSFGMFGCCPCDSSRNAFFGANRPAFRSKVGHSFGANRPPPVG